MQVETTDAPPPEWEELVRADDKATFFHTSDWIGLLAGRSPRRRGLYVCAFDGNDLIAGLPAVVERRGPVSVVSSMPHGTYGGIVLRK